MKNKLLKIFSLILFAGFFVALVGVGRAEAYTITFNGNTNTGGSTPAQTINQGSTTPLTLNGFTKTNYAFIGWATIPTGSVVYTDGANYTANANVTLYAKWVAVYTITFDANGGTGTPFTQNINSGATANLTANTYTRTNYVFAGWATTPTGSVAYADGASYAMTGGSNVTLYAKWNVITHTITFSANGGVGASTTQTINQGSSTSLILNGFTKTNYAFAGWATTPTGSVTYADGATYTMGNTDVILYAKWTALCTYTQSVTAWSSCSVGMRYATAVTNATAPAGSPLCADNLPTVQACSQDIDGNDFGIINIGTQTWMADNLKTTKYKDGSSLTIGTGISNLMAWPNNNTANKDIYGGLYNYTAVASGNLCPTGWHVATTSEWMTLKNYVGGDAGTLTGSTGYYYDLAGGKLKTIDRGGTNDYQFSARGGGKYDSDYGWSYALATSSYLWIGDSSYTPSGTSTTYGKSINDSLTSDNLYYQYPRDKRAKLSVRCIKDTSYVPAINETCYDPSVAPTLKPLSQVFNVNTVSGLVAYWPLDATTTGNVFPDVKNGNNLTISGTWVNNVLTRTADIQDKTMYFDGTANLYLNSATNLAPAGNYSVCQWYRQESSTGSMQELISGRNALSTWTGFELQTDTNIPNFRGGDYANTLTLTPIPSYSVWHHVCYTKQGTNSNFYVDGNSVSSSTAATTGINPFPTYLLVGRDYGGTEFFKGYMDDISIWNRGLSACEVKSLYSGRNACLPSCVFSVTCNVNPLATTTGQSVTWTATSTGGTAPYKYSWKFTDFPDILDSLTADTVTKIYSATGTKYATTTITDGASPAKSVTVSCPGTVGESGGGITIDEPTVNGNCVTGGAYLDKPTNSGLLCLTGIPSAVSESGPWTWSCLGSGPGHTDATDCTASKLNPQDPNLTCTLSAASTTAKVNTNTVWTVSSPSSFTEARWSTGSATTTKVGDTFNNIFTTIGLKTVTAEIASSTEGVFGPPCTATTTVVQTGGTNREY